MTESLVDRVAIVTGGSRGIGLATAVMLRAEGADVLVCGRSEAALNRAGAHLVQTPGAGRVATVVADVRRHDEAERLVTAAVDELGAVDILVNNAGIGRFGPASELAVDAWIETIETNLSGVFYCCRAAIPVMKRRGKGWIVNVSSLAGKAPVRRRGRVLRVQGGPERADRVADAGGPPGRHPGELRAAWLGEHRVRWRPSVHGRGLEAGCVGRRPGRSRPAASPSTQPSQPGRAAPVRPAEVRPLDPRSPPVMWFSRSQEEQS